MPVATADQYAEMLDRAVAGRFAFPAVNVGANEPALRLFQPAQGRAATGQLTPETLAALGVDAGAGGTSGSGIGQSGAAAPTGQSDASPEQPAGATEPSQSPSQ
jgi:hypothetical protein